MIMYDNYTTLYCNINVAVTEGIINPEHSHGNVWLKLKNISLSVAKTIFFVFHLIK